MKSNQELGEIGRLAALPVQLQIDGCSVMRLESVRDAPAREAFAAVVAAAVRRECAETTQQWQQAATKREHALETRNNSLFRQVEALQNIADKRQEGIVTLTAENRTIRARMIELEGKLAALAKLPEEWRKDQDGAQSLVTVCGCAYEVEKALGIAAPTYQTSEVDQQRREDAAAINAVMDPHAHLKAAWAAGKRIRFDGGRWVQKPDGMGFYEAPDCYEIEPDATPADPWAKEKAAYARGEKIEYRKPSGHTWRLCADQPMWLIGAGEYRIAPKPEVQPSQTVMDPHAHLKVDWEELARHQWRPVSMKPTKGDADAEGYVFVCSADGRSRGIHRIDWPFHKGTTHWRPFIPPPQPSAEELERQEFEKWANHRGLDCHIGNEPDRYGSTQTDWAWGSWQAARASKEVKA